MKTPILVSSLLLVAAIPMSAQQTDVPKLTGRYLGQKPPGMSAETFAPGIISTASNYEFFSSSPDGAKGVTGE